MKKDKKAVFFILINILCFAASCVMASFLSDSKLDSISNQVASYTNLSLDDAQKYPLISVKSTSDSYDYRGLYNHVYYNWYVYYHRCVTDITLYDETTSINLSLLSQPTFWSTEYSYQDETVYKLDHSTYFLKYKSEYDPHGNDTFIYLSQKTIQKIADEKGVTENDILNTSFHFKDKHGSEKTAYISNIIVDGLGLAPYQESDYEYYGLSYLLYDPALHKNYDARFEIRMKINPHGNKSLMRACMTECPSTEYEYSLFGWDGQKGELSKNSIASESLNALTDEADAALMCAIIVLLVCYFGIDIAIAFNARKRGVSLFWKSLASIILFAAIGIVFTFIYTYYIFGFFSLAYFLIDGIPSIIQIARRAFSGFSRIAKKGERINADKYQI